ncbi:Dps family protein [Paenibacillus hamazuiensis]|uniref:Dps family protein n=1 Tax=Paenibacillus hamazuiensis TaxID=2936508 RepID=UPI003B84ABBE
MSRVVEALNRQIAGWNVLYVKLHNYHWNVKGPQFFTLHAKFQQLYEEAALHIDELAERVLALGGAPIATMKQYLEISSVQEASGHETAEQMVAAIVHDYKTVIGELKEGMALAQETGDETTSDMLLAIHTELEKHVWMLNAFLQ